MVLLKNSSHSGFVARQVAAYSEQFKKLSVPELRETCKKRNLDFSGKKQQLLLRLSIWVRDELAAVAPSTDDGSETTEETNLDLSNAVDPKREETPRSTYQNINLSPNFEDALDIGKLATLTDQSEKDDDDDNSEESSYSSSDDELEFLAGPSGQDLLTRSKLEVMAKQRCKANENGNSEIVSVEKQEEENYSEEPIERRREKPNAYPVQHEVSSQVDAEIINESEGVFDSEEDEDDDDEDNTAKSEMGDVEGEGEELLPEPRKRSTSREDQAKDKNAVDPDNPIQSMLFSLFGYSGLRHGQEWAIKRCLDKQRTLLVAPTGFGKSMCYVIPAAIMDGITVVVSPLISLIQDQLRELPPRVPAATLSGSLTTAAAAAIVDDVIRKRIKVLFVSPERLASASFQRLFQPKWNADTKTYQRPFPPVSLLAVDEAHCLSQWAHNFRPSYLRLRSLLDKIEPQSVLAITATAGRQVVEDICRTLKIERCDAAMTSVKQSCKANNCSCGVWKMKSDRDNINVESFIVKTQERRLSMVRNSNCVLIKCTEINHSKLNVEHFILMQKLVSLLKPAKTQGRGGDKNSDNHPGLIEGCLTKGSVIVYVWRQKDAEVVAESIQASGVGGGVVFYHGGMDSGSRANAYSKVSVVR